METLGWEIRNNRRSAIIIKRDHFCQALSCEDYQIRIPRAKTAKLQLLKKLFEFEPFCPHWSCSPSTGHTALWPVEWIRSSAVRMDQTGSRRIPSLCWIFPFDQLELFGDNYDNKIESAHDMNVTTINSTTGGYEVRANYTFMVSTTCIQVLLGCVLWVSSYSCYFWEDNLSWLCSRNFKLHLHLLCTWILNACQISIMLA